MRTASTCTRELQPFSLPAEIERLVAAHRNSDETTEPLYYWHISRDIGVEPARLRLAEWLDDRQLQALINGVTFPVGDLSVRACMYSSAGNRIHLQWSVTSTTTYALAGLRPIRYTEEFVPTPICGQRGGCLDEFDDDAFSLLSRSDGALGGRYKRPAPLTADEMLAEICIDCCKNAVSVSRHICAHDFYDRYCPACSELGHLQYMQYQRELDAAIAEVSEILGSAMIGCKVKELRAHPQVSRIRELLRPHAEVGRNMVILGERLGWRGQTLSSLLSD